MGFSAVVATESQLGRSQPGSAEEKAGRKRSKSSRSGSAAEITRPSLMKELSSRGVRITSQRRLLVGIIQDSPRHLDAAKLLQLAQKHDAEIDRATVYRTLALLKGHGLIDELDLMHIEGEKHFYEAKTNRDHCHMACFRCGAIMEFVSSSFEKLKSEMAAKSGFKIRVVRLEVGGVCKQCSKTQN
jgi:Fur family ferric uptake transcriptional regulator